MTSPSGSKAESGGGSLARGSWAAPRASPSAGPMGRLGGLAGGCRAQESELPQEGLVSRVPGRNFGQVLGKRLRLGDRRPRGRRDPVHQQSEELLLAAQLRHQVGHVLAPRIRLLTPRSASSEESVEQGRVISAVVLAHGCGGVFFWGGFWLGTSPSNQPRAVASQPRPASSESVTGPCPEAGAGASAPSERSSRAVSKAIRAAAVTSWMPCQTL